MKYKNEELSKQLSCPCGAEARQIGENMFQSNCNMIFETINALDIRPNTKIFEIGFGNGMHLPYLFEKESTLIYEGLEISEAMVEEANLNNTTFVQSDKATFRQITDADTLSVPDDSYDYCFSVNTLYFWNNPQKYFDEIYHSLRSGGKIAIGFIAKSFGEKLPFTQTGFTFYEIEEVGSLLTVSGFRDIQVLSLTENAISKDGSQVVRPFVIVTATKGHSKSLLKVANQYLGS